VKIRDYSGPLTVLAAGVLGFSLICIVSAAALANPRTSSASELGAQDIVNAGYANPIGTMAALTEVQVTAYISTPTLPFTETIPPTLTAILYITPTKPFVTWTPLPPTRTRMGRPSATPTQLPTRTPSKIPPTPTFTPRPTFTDTPLPPTDTPVPPTDTPVPPTDTPVPPTNTLEPPPPPPPTPTPVDTATSAPPEGTTAP
jgi:hypothetical protein